MGQGGGQFGFAKKSLDLFGFAENVLPNYFENHHAFEKTMFGLVYRAHSAHVEQFKNVIAGMIKQLGRQDGGLRGRCGVLRNRVPNTSPRITRAKIGNRLLASDARLHVTVNGRTIKITQMAVEEL